MITDDESLPDYLEQEQVAALLKAAKAAKAASIRDCALLLLVYKYGLRVHEASAFNRNQVNFARRKIRIVRGKGSRSGEFSLFRDVHSSLTEYLRTRKDRSPALFVGRRGRLQKRRIEQLFELHANTAGIPKKERRSIHSLKHSLAVHMLDAGKPLETIQDWLGHRSIGSTQVYARISSRRRRAAVANELENDPNIVSLA